jgi:hypothetical protein
MNPYSTVLFIPWRRVCLGLLASLLVCGCTAKKDARGTPEETARQSLDAALTAWRNGQPTGELPNASPPVQVVDSVWAKGRKLESYEILNAGTETDGLRWFSVRLTLGNPNANEEVRYVVKGRSPVWVYRQEDLKRSQNWQGYK